MHKTQKLKIAFIGSEGIPYPNAFSKITEEIAKRLVNRGHKIVVYGRKHLVKNSNDYLGIKRINLPSIRSKHLETITNSFISTIHACYNHKAFDIIHIHGIGPSILSIIPRVFGIKSVVHIHALDWKREKWGKIAKLYLRLSEYTSLIFPNEKVHL